MIIKYTTPVVKHTMNLILKKISFWVCFSSTLTVVYGSPLDKKIIDVDVIDDRSNSALLALSEVETRSLPKGTVARVSGYWNKEDAGKQTRLWDGQNWILKNNGEIALEQFGAIANADVANHCPFDNSAAIDSLIAYIQSLNRGVWFKDDRKGGKGNFRTSIRIYSNSGGVYGISKPIILPKCFRSIQLDHLSFRAIGNTWAATDYMIDREGGAVTYVSLDNINVNCERKCSGIRAQSFWYILRPVIRSMAKGGVGLCLQGVKSYVQDPDIVEIGLENHTHFFEEKNFGAIGLKINNNDNRIVGGEIAWCKICVLRENGVNNQISKTHIFNGMSNYVKYNKDGSLRELNPSSHPATGRIRPVLIQINSLDKKSAAGSFVIEDVYFDNGIIEIFDDRGVILKNCEYANNINTSPKSILYWIINYSRITNQKNELVIIGSKPLVKSLPKKLIKWVNYVGNWENQTDFFENSGANYIDQWNASLSVYGKNHLLSTNGPIIKQNFSLSHGAYYKYRDNCSSKEGVIMGAQGNNAYFGSPEGKFIFQNTTTKNAVEISADSGILSSLWTGKVRKDGAGSILEKGKNHGGLFTKIADGTLICRIQNIKTTVDKKWIYPCKFISKPTVTVSVKSVTPKIATVYEVNKESVIVNTFNLNGQKINNVNVDLIAIGRWK